MNQQLDDSKESAVSQSMERYLQVESGQESISPPRQVQTQRTESSHVGPSILKLQNGKYSNQQTVFKEALNKKKTELHKKQQKQIIEQQKYEHVIKLKEPKKTDKLQQNIKLVQQKTEELKKKREEEKQREEKLKQSKTEQIQKEDIDEVFQETVNRLYNYEKKRIKELNKKVEEEKNKDKRIMTARPMINENSCRLLDRKLKQLIEAEDDYKQIYQFKDIEVQVDLLPNLPKLKDFLQINVKKINQIGQIEIIKEEFDNDKIDIPQDIQYQLNQSHKQIQTNEIKYKLSDTISKSQIQQNQLQNTSQFQVQETPNKKVINQRQKRMDFMETQGQRIKTECQYYVPLHIRQQKVIQKKIDWINSQKEIKKQQLEESERIEKEQWEKEKEKWSKKKDQHYLQHKSMQQQELDLDEFAHSQITWLEKRNEHILTEQMKKDKHMQESLTFRPKIHKKNFENSYNSTKVEDRLLEYQQKKQDNLQKLENKYLPTFHPNINQKTAFAVDWASRSFCNTSFNKLWQ